MSTGATRAADQAAEAMRALNYATDIDGKPASIWRGGNLSEGICPDCTRAGRGDRGALDHVLREYMATKHGEDSGND